jgi:hypothetical protein
VPCHRVVREDGKLAGYRWGLERKKSLQERERRLQAASKKQHHLNAEDQTFDNRRLRAMRPPFPQSGKSGHLEKMRAANRKSKSSPRT